MKAQSDTVKGTTWLKVFGFLGFGLWALTIFLRGTAVVQHDTVNFLLGIAPNFGAALVLPMMAVIYYPIAFKRELSVATFRYSLVAIFLFLFLSEVVHDLFLNSRFDPYDLIASLIALGIVALLYKQPEPVPAPA